MKIDLVVDFIYLNWYIGATFGKLCVDIFPFWPGIMPIYLSKLFMSSCDKFYFEQINPKYEAKPSNGYR